MEATKALLTKANLEVAVGPRMEALTSALVAVEKHLRGPSSNTSDGSEEVEGKHAVAVTCQLCYTQTSHAKFVALECDPFKWVHATCLAKAKDTKGACPFCCQAF